MYHLSIDTNEHSMAEPIMYEARGFPLSNLLWALECYLNRVPRRKWRDCCEWQNDRAVTCFHEDAINPTAMSTWMAELNLTAFNSKLYIPVGSAYIARQGKAKRYSHGERQTCKDQLNIILPHMCML